MRPLHLLFALYVFGLSMITCTDGLRKDNCGKAIHLHAKQTSQQSEDECCTPFCVCSCCSNVVVTKVESLTIVTLVKEQQVIAPVTISLSADPAPIWHPPKIS